MNRFYKVFCFIAIVGLLAASPAWGAELVWVGGDSGGAHDVTISANWNPSGPGNNDSWFVNTPSTGSYPIFTGTGTTDLTVWDVMVGRIDVWPRGGDPWHPTDPGYLLQEGGALHVNATFQIGQGNNTTKSLYVMTGGVVQKSSLGWTKIGGESSLAEMVLSGNAQYNQAGDWFVVGTDSGSNGSVTMSDTASISLQSDFHIGLRGATGSMTIGPNNTFYSRGWSSVGYDIGSVGTMTTAGTITHSAQPIFIGRNGASGTWNQIGGSTIFNDKFAIGGDNGNGSTTSIAILNISGGGLVSARQIGPWNNSAAAAGNSSTLNIDNGILRPYYKPDEPDRNADWLQKYLTVYVMAGGATIDSNKNSLTVNAPLLDGSTNPNGGTAGGGLTKTGIGNLTLTAANNTYTGGTVVQAGQLTLAVGSDEFPGFDFTVKNQITVRPGATLANDANSVRSTALNADLVLDAKSILSVSVNTAPSWIPMRVLDISAGAGSGPAIIKLSGADPNTGLPGSGPVVYYSSEGNGGVAPTYIPWLDSVGQFDLAVSDSGSSIDAVTTYKAGSRGWISGTWDAGSWKEVTVPGKFTGTPPASSPDKAWFDSSLATPGPVTLDIPVVLSSMLFTAPSASGFTIAPAAETQATNTITLSSSTASIAQIQVLSGSHEVSADIKMAAGDPLVTVYPGNSLTLSGALSDLVSGQPADITFDGRGSASGTEWTSISTTQGTLTLSGNNTFTGTVVMSGIGRLEIANGNALGAGTGNIVLNGTLAYTGSADVPTTVSTVRGLTFAGWISNNNDGENRNGTFNYIDIPANINLQFNGLTDIGTGFSALRKLGPGTLTFANAGVNTLSDCDIDIGEGTIVLDAGTFNKSRTNLYFQNNGGDIAVGDVGGKTGDLTIQNGAKLYSAGDLNVGRWGGMGHLTVTGAGSSFTNTEASAFIGRDGGTGYVTVNGPGVSFNCRYLAIGDNSTGTLTVTNGSANINDEMNVGRYTGNGHLVINGDTSAIVNSNVRTFIGRDGAPGDAIVTGAGSVFNNQYLAVGDNSVATLKVENGAVLNVLNDNVDVGRNNNVVLGNGTVTTDGTVTIARGHLFLGGVGATGVWNQNGGTTTMPNAVFLGEWDSDTAPGVGILNLNGGTFALNAIKYSDWRDANAGGAQTEPATVLSTQTVNFDGGTLKALQNDGGFIYTKGSPNFHVYFKANGGTIDTNGFDVTAGLAFESGAPSDGGMNKIGAGTLTVTGAIQYEGDTTVTAGTLTAAGGINTPLATVYVNTGSTLNATSIVADTLTIGGTHVPVAAATVPEPSTFALLILAGLGGLLAWRRK